MRSAILLALVAGACAPAHGELGSVSLGLFLDDADGPRVISSDGAPQGDTVRVAVPSVDGEPAFLGAVALSDPISPGDSGVAAVGADATARRAVAPVMDPPVAVGFALLDPNVPARIAGRTVETDLDGDGDFETLEMCLAAEGLWLAAFDGTTPVWQAYHALGYDVEPTCEGDFLDAVEGR